MNFLKKITCKKCGIFLLHKDGLCKKCYYQNAIRIQGLNDYVIRLKEQINGGFVKLELYFKRYNLIENSMKEIYDITEESPSIVTLTPNTFEEYRKLLIIDITNRLEESKKTVFQKQEFHGNKKIHKDWDKIIEQLIEIKIKFPSYSEVLSFYIDDLSNLKKTYEKND